MRRLALLAALAAAGAHAEDESGYCPDRPGLTTSPCVVEPRRASVETSLVDWTRERSPEARADTVLVGDTVARIGLGDRIEARIGWTPLGIVRERDGATGAASRAVRAGDVTLGFKAALPARAGTPAVAALLPYVTLPAGRRPVGADDWSAGLLVPLALDLDDGLALVATPEVAAAADEDGNGRHLAYGGAAGVAWGLSASVELTAEAGLVRDHDPDGPGTEALGSLSLAWMARDGLQFDVQAVTGLNRRSPDLELVAGIAARF